MSNWNWTASSWHKRSSAGTWFRSAKFNAIEKAIARYSPAVDDAAVRLTALKKILDAISEWRIWKEQDKFGKPLGSTMASKVSTLRKDGQVGSGEQFSVREDVVDELIRDIAREIDDVLAAERAAWGFGMLSDPRRHNRDKFLYLVTAQTETREIVDFREWTVENPTLIEGATISASLISQDNVKLWGPSGFILKAPKRCIGAAFSQDLAVKNQAGLMHTVEKYRELLRVYLGQALNQGQKVVGLRSPLDILPTSINHHSEVMVLGRNYDKATSVSGIFVIVDRIKMSVGGIEPVRCFRVTQRWKKVNANPPQWRFLGERMPSTTDRRMAQYRSLHESRGVPIIQIPMSDKVHIGPKYFGGLYEGMVQFPYNPATMFEKNSAAHKVLEVELKKGMWEEVKIDV